MDYLDFEDRLEPVGIAVGALLVLIGVATVLGMPWGVKPIGPALVQVVAALATAGIGAGLLYLSRVDD